MKTTAFSHPTLKPFNPKRWNPGPSPHDQNLSRISHILQTHPLPHSTREKCAEMVAQIRHRLADQRLYLAVAGEFSAGKSTFLNALLREQLLDSHVTEGTTVIPTFIEYRPPSLWEHVRRLFGKSDNRTVEVFFEAPDSPSLRLNAMSNESHYEALKRGLGNSFSQIIRDARATRIGISADSISDGLVIIDTPGINSNNPQHLEYARRTIERWADAVAVLTSASQPLPISLCSFIRENLGGSLRRCILIASHLDTVRPSHRKRQLDFIARKYMQEFGVEPLAVLGAAPLLVVLNASGRKEDQEEIASFGKSAEGLIEQFSETETQLRKILDREKSTLIGQRIQQLLGVLLSSLEQHLSSLETENVYALDAARTRRPEQLMAFTKRQREKYLGHFRSELRGVSEQTVGQLSSEFQEIERGVKNGIDASLKPVDLGKFMRENPLKSRQTRSVKLAHHLFKETLRSLSELCFKLFEEYRGDLSEAYPSLKLKGSGPKLTVPRLSVTPAKLEGEYKRSIKPLEQFGRGIGVTFLTNWFKGNQIAGLRAEARSTTESCIRELQTKWKGSLEVFTEMLGEHLAKELDRLASFYNEKASGSVAELHARHLDVESSLEKNLQRVRKDLDWVRKEARNDCMEIPPLPADRQKDSACGPKSPPPLPGADSRPKYPPPLPAHENICT